METTRPSHGVRRSRRQRFLDVLVLPLLLLGLAACSGGGGGGGGSGSGASSLVGVWDAAVEVSGPFSFPASYEFTITVDGDRGTVVLAGDGQVPSGQIELPRVADGLAGSVEFLGFPTTWAFTSTGPDTMRGSMNAPSQGVDYVWTATRNTGGASRSRLADLMLISEQTQAAIPLTPGFDPGVLVFVANADSNTDSFRIFLVPEDPSATVRVNGDPFDYRNVQNPWSIGSDRTMTIAVTVGDETTTYTVLVSNRGGGGGGGGGGGASAMVGRWDVLVDVTLNGQPLTQTQAEIDIAISGNTATLVATTPGAPPQTIRLPVVGDRLQGTQGDERFDVFSTGQNSLGGTVVLTDGSGIEQRWTGSRIGSN